jgi:putative ABC transport system substrate-binding protein
MRESCTYGSVRGALSNERPYRNRATMQRREFLTLLGGAAAAWPLAARAQQPLAMPMVGYLLTGTREGTIDFVAGFRRGMGEIGFVEGRNVAVEYRWSNNVPGRVTELAADLVQRRVAVISASSTAAALAAKSATATIPIVFYSGVDAVQSGLVAKLSRPEGNVTGINSMNAELGAKRLGLLHELLPRVQRFGILVPATAPLSAENISIARAAATAMGLPLEVLPAITNREIDAAFARAVEKRVDALIIASSQTYAGRRVQLATLAVRHAMPAIFPFREGAEAGGLMS